MGKTPIEWVRNADGEQGHSINPIRFRNLKTGKVGHHCEKISAGCKNCYASTMNGGPYLSGLTYIAENTPKGEYFLDDTALQQVLRRKKPTAYFWCDMTDMFGEWVPDEWIDNCFAVMALTPQHRHFVLTKRSVRLLNWACAPGCLLRFDEIRKQAALLTRSVQPEYAWPLPNVWLGVSVEDQQRKRRIDILREVPATVRFLSLEPLLEDLGTLDLRGIDWVIVGGESGPGARPMHPAWARSIRDQCVAAGVPFFFKQWGEWGDSDAWMRHCDNRQCKSYDFPASSVIEVFLDGKSNGLKGEGVARWRAGKAAAGYVLDGHAWSQMPEARP